MAPVGVGGKACPFSSVGVDFYYMTSITFNTLAFTKRLQEAGFDEKQAETVVETVVNVLAEAQESLVTREYFDSRLEVIEARLNGRLNLIQWMLAAVIVAEVLPLLKTLFS